ncbi:MAG TPA: hypothetical protein VN088_17385, partial [Nocardioides sp.]|nr:hypothetical protein [Nocardioides sp.]
PTHPPQPTRPPAYSPAGPPPPPVQSPPTAWPAGHPGGPTYSPSLPGAPRKSRKALWIGGALALLLVVGGGVGAVVATSGGDSPDKPTDDPSASSDLSAAGIQQRYAGLGSNIAASASDCKALDPATGESEAVSCTTSNGTLQLTTYASLGALKRARHDRFDRERGSLANNAGTTAYYSYDPAIDSDSSTPALVYWDTETDLQSATLTGNDGVKLADVESLFRKADAPVGPPTGVVNPLLSRFLDYWIDDDSVCKPSPIYLKGETEELYCKIRFRGTAIGISFGRFSDRGESIDNRDYYQGQYQTASTRGAGPRWVFTDSRDYLDGGARYTYVNDDSSKTYTVEYWDWHYDGCACYATAFTKGSNTALLDAWWTTSLADY